MRDSGLAKETFESGNKGKQGCSTAVKPRDESETAYTRYCIREISERPN